MRSIEGVLCGVCRNAIPRILSIIDSQLSRERTLYFFFFFFFSGSIVEIDTVLSYPRERMHMISK